MAVDARHRDKNGEISRKHGNTLIRTLRPRKGPWQQYPARGCAGRCATLKIWAYVSFHGLDLWTRFMAIERHSRKGFQRRTVPFANVRHLVPFDPRLESGP